MADETASLTRLMETLHQARTSDGAVQSLSRFLDQHLQQYAGLTPLRVVALIRPSGRARAVHEVVLSATHAPPPPSSLTAWRWIAGDLQPVLLDVSGRRVYGAGAPEDGRPGRWPEDFRSRDGLLAWQVSHILAFPLRWPGGTLEGMLYIEANWSPPTRLPQQHWASLKGPIQLMVDVATPFFSHLPQADMTPVEPDRYLPVIGRQMQSVVRRLQAFSRLGAPLLLQGETGVGKSQLARWVKEHSRRAAHPFETVNMQAIPDALRETHLFGVKKGAFTGASQDQDGIVTLAEGGTLFIDEIDKLPISAQAGLLSLLEDGTFRVIGDTRERRADIRFIIGTNANLKKAVQEGRFLRDLYYRIHVLPVHIPRLADRRDDIGPWADVMLRTLHRHEVGTGEAVLEEGARRLLTRQPWPGNLRELNSLVSQAYALALSEQGASVPQTLHVLQRHVEEALCSNNGFQHLVFDSMQTAARAFVEEVIRRKQPNGISTLTLKHSEAFKGIVLQEACVRQDTKTAFQLLGRGNASKHHNHNKILKNETEKVHTLQHLLEAGPLSKP